MAFGYYKEPDEGIDAAYELKALWLQRRDEVESILTEISKAEELGGGPDYHSLPWGKLYLFEEKRCFSFIRRSSAAATEWLFVMFGEWERDDARQRAEAGRRFEASRTQ